MSFERTQYDPCAYKQDVAQSARIGNYALEAPVRNCGACFSRDPFVRVQRGGTAASCVPAALTDVDSDMMGLLRTLSRCPDQPPRFTCEASAGPAECGDTPFTEATRLSNPPCTLRGTGWNRWQWLHFDPQEHATTPFQTQIANRIVVKDNHRPCLHEPLDPTPLLPVEQPQKPPLAYGGTGRVLPMFHWRPAAEINCL